MHAHVAGVLVRKPQAHHAPHGGRACIVHLLVSELRRTFIVAARTDDFELAAQLESLHIGDRVELAGDAYVGECPGGVVPETVIVRINQIIAVERADNRRCAGCQVAGRPNTWSLPGQRLFCPTGGK